MIRLFRPFLIAGLIFASALQSPAAPPKDPKARKVYDHNYQWLSTMSTNSISTNIRGENDQQYPERRQAALDLIRERHDITMVPELIDELQRNTFLSGDICDIFGEWKTKKALPLLTEVSNDPHRSKEVRQRAQRAIKEINSAPQEVDPRPKY